MMFSTVLVYLFMFFISLPIVLLITSFIIGVVQGVQGGNDNGFDDFVNSNRYSDNR